MCYFVWGISDQWKRWRNWKVEFPWDNLMTEGGYFCGVDHSDLNSTGTCYSGRRKRLEVWYRKTRKHVSPYSRVIIKILKTRSDKPKYSFHRQGWWRARLLNTYTSEPLLTPAHWIRTCLLKELRKTLSQLNWFANWCWKDYRKYSQEHQGSREASLSFSWMVTKSLMSCVLTSSNFFGFVFIVEKITLCLFIPLWLRQ